MSSCLTSRDLLLLSQTTTKSPPRHTSNHMSNTQCERLVDLCKQYYEIISDTGNSIESRTQRRRIWEYIAQQLNEKAHTSFTAAQYKKKYQNLKTSLKAKMNAIKKAQATTAGNNNTISIKKASDASTTSTTASSAFSPMGFTQLPSQMGAFPSSLSLFHSPSLASSSTPTTSSLLAPTPVSFSAALAAAAAPPVPAGTQQQQIYAPIPQMGLPLNLQTLMSTVIANEQAAAAAVTAGRSPIPLTPGASEPLLLSPVRPQSRHSERSTDTLMSSPGAALQETLALAEADPVDVFCQYVLGRVNWPNSLGAPAALHAAQARY